MTSDVSFEISKLLKEKGFEDMIKSYDGSGKEVNVSLVVRKHVPTQMFYPRPTITEVVMWLYEKYDIWANIVCSIGSFNVYTIETRTKSKSLDIGSLCYTNYDTPGEAYLAAIKHILINLIQ